MCSYCAFIGFICLARVLFCSNNFNSPVILFCAKFQMTIFDEPAIPLRRLSECLQKPRIGWFSHSHIHFIISFDLHTFPFSPLPSSTLIYPRCIFSIFSHPNGLNPFNRTMASNSALTAIFLLKVQTPFRYKIHHLLCEQFGSNEPKTIISAQMNFANRMNTRISMRINQVSMSLCCIR